MSKKMPSEITIDDITFKRASSIWLTGIQACKLQIEYSKFDAAFYEEISGEAEFIQDISFGYLNESNEFQQSSNNIKLNIRKSSNDLEESARLNYAKYLNIEDNVKEFGLSNCIHNGFSHLSIFDGATVCILILEDRVFEKVISLIKNNSLTTLSFAADYLSIYTDEKLSNGHIAAENQLFYIINSRNSAESNSTFGAISELNITSNEWSYFNNKRQNVLSKSLDSVETEKLVLKELRLLKKIILYSFITIIVILLYIAFD